jgi:hypothetical protein
MDLVSMRETFCGGFLLISQIYCIDKSRELQSWLVSLNLPFVFCMMTVYLQSHRYLSRKLQSWQSLLLAFLFSMWNHPSCTSIPFVLFGCLWRNIVYLLITTRVSVILVQEFQFKVSKYCGSEVNVLHNRLAPD